jgi:hypothetical protein
MRCLWYSSNNLRNILRIVLNISILELAVGDSEHALLYSMLDVQQLDLDLMVEYNVVCVMFFYDLSAWHRINNHPVEKADQVNW